MTPRLKAVAEWRSLDRSLKIDRGSTVALRAVGERFVWPGLDSMLFSA